MGSIVIAKTSIPDLLVIEPRVFRDTRGYFVETWNERDLTEAGLSVAFVQDNESKSCKGVLRGLHFQRHRPQGRLLRAVMGTIFDVAVDLHQDSPTLDHWGRRSPLRRKQKAIMDSAGIRPWLPRLK